MSVETFNVNQVVSVTPSAEEHFLKQLSKKQAAAIRISLEESGCTGYKYIIDEVDNGEPSDVLITLENNVKLYVDVKHLSAIQGTVVDYVSQGLNKNLVLNNPNIKEACGCGESFSV